MKAHYEILISDTHDSPAEIAVYAVGDDEYAMRVASILFAGYQATHPDYDDILVSVCEVENLTLETGNGGYVVVGYISHTGLLAVRS